MLEGREFLLLVCDGKARAIGWQNAHVHGLEKKRAAPDRNGDPVQLGGRGDDAIRRSGGESFREGGEEGQQEVQGGGGGGARGTILADTTEGCGKGGEKPWYNAFMLRGAGQAEKQGGPRRLRYFLAKVRGGEKDLNLRRSIFNGGPEKVWMAVRRSVGQSPV